MPPSGMGGYIPTLDPGLYEQTRLAQLARPTPGPLSAMDVKAVGAASPWAAVLGAVGEGLNALKNRAREERIQREAENEQAQKHYLDQLTSILNDPSLTPQARAEISKMGSQHLAAMVDAAAKGTKDGSTFRRILRDLGGGEPLPSRIDPLVEANRIRTMMEQRPDWKIDTHIRQATNKLEEAKREWIKNNPQFPEIPQEQVVMLASAIYPELRSAVGKEEADTWLSSQMSTAVPFTSPWSLRRGLEAAMGQAPPQPRVSAGAAPAASPMQQVVVGGNVPPPSYTTPSTSVPTASTGSSVASGPTIKPGDRVRLASGEVVTVKAVRPDNTFEY